VPSSLGAAFRAAYLDLLLAAAAAYGNGTRFVLTCGPLRTDYCGAVDDVVGQAVGLGLQVHSLQLQSTASCCAHPDAVEFAELGAQATAAIRSMLAW